MSTAGSMLVLGGQSSSGFPWPPAPRQPYVLPPYQGDRDLWFTPPPQPDLRFCRGDEWSVEIPGLPYLPGYTSLEYPDRCLTGFYPLWDADWRKRIREAHQARGYTHFTIWLGDCYKAMQITPTQFANFCEELASDGFFVRAWLGGKSIPGWIPNDSRVDVWRQYLDPYLDAAAGVLHHAVIGGEYDLWNIGEPNDPTPFEIADYVVQKVGPTGALVYFHFSTHVTFWGNTPGQWNGQQIHDRFDWTRVMCDMGVRGIGYQGGCPYEWTIPELQARIADTLGKVDPRWDFVLEEPGPAYAQFPANAHPNEQEACEIGYAGVITKPANGRTDVHVQGFLNGAYQPSGIGL